jgi:putative sterol carrier protein
LVEYSLKVGGLRYDSGPFANQGERVSKFLTEAWAKDVTAALNSHEGFKNAIGAAELGIQFTTEGGPDGDVDYFLKSSGGTSNLGIGTLDDPDVTVKQSYDTATAISKGDLNTQTAFMTGKLKVSGNLAKLMMHQSAIQQWNAATADLEVEY